MFNLDKYTANTMPHIYQKTIWNSMDLANEENHVKDRKFVKEISEF